MMYVQIFKTCELRIDLIFLWIKVGSVIHTFIRATHQRENVQFGKKIIAMHLLYNLYQLICNAFNFKIISCTIFYQPAEKIDSQ
jgi:hypothetical protein